MEEEKNKKIHQKIEKLKEEHNYTHFIVLFLDENNKKIDGFLGLENKEQALRDISSGIHYLSEIYSMVQKDEIIVKPRTIQ